MKAWQVHEYGHPMDALQLEELPRPEPEAGQIRVKVEAITLNYNDLDGIQGRYRTVRPPLPFVPGMEVLGYVDACGEGAENWLDLRVCAVPEGAFGGFAEYALCPTAMAFEMPTDMPVDKAAAFYYPFHLASLGMFERGQLIAGETVMIHAAAGGIGSAAIQLAKQAGARVIASAGSQSKLDFCRELGADHTINYRNGDFSEQVNAITDGAGADVIFDSIGGTVTEQSLRCLAFNGRLLLVGFAAGIEAEDESTITPRPLLFGNYSMCGVCHAYVDDPIAFRQQTGLNFPSHASGVEMHEKLLKLYRDGAIKSVIGQVHPFERLPLAFEKILSRESVGRSVVLLET